MNLRNCSLIEVRFKPHPGSDDKSRVAGALIVFTFAYQDAVDNPASRRRNLVVFQRFLALLKGILGAVNRILSDFLLWGRPFTDMPALICASL